MDIHHLIKNITDSGSKFSVIIAGYGGSFVSDLVIGDQPVVHVEIVFSDAAAKRHTRNYHNDLESPTTARQLGQRALGLLKAIEKDDISSTVSLFGIGAVVLTSKIIISVWGKKQEYVVHEHTIPFSNLEMAKDQVDRTVGAALIHTMALAAGIDIEASLKVKSNLRDICTKVCDVPDPVSSVLSATIPYVVINENGDYRTESWPFESDLSYEQSTVRLLYPGSFRPLHWGHTELALEASTFAKSLHSEHSAKAVILTFELSTTVADKGNVDEFDLRKRLEQFAARGLRVAVTSAKLFVEKARLFKNHGFVVGVDTVRRILNPQYYGSMSDMISALLEIRRNGCFFVVGGRKTADDWDEMEKVEVPMELSGMFFGIPAHKFRVDISSTELRALSQTSAPK